MSLHPQQPIPSVPEQTVRIARAAFPKGSPYLTLRDTLGTIFVDGHFADLYPKQGQPACPPWRLALITLMQFREGLSDRQAAEAVRARIDWKYLLGLELSDPGFDFSVLCEFRDRLRAGGAQERLLERVPRSLTPTMVPVASNTAILTGRSSSASNREPDIRTPGVRQIVSSKGSYGSSSICRLALRRHKHASYRQA